MKKFLFFIFLIISINLFSNDSEDKLFIIEDATFHSNDLSESLQYFLKNPIEINFAPQQQLLMLPWLDEEIVKLIISARSDKKLTSKKALIKIGMNEITVNEIMPYISFTKNETKHLFSRTYYSVVESDIHENSPYKSYQKIQYIFPHFSLGGQIQKDIKEVNYADFYSYYFVLQDYKFVKKLIVGKYRLAFGEGLLFSPALGAKKTSATTTVPMKKSLSIKPYTSSFEMWDLEGVVTHLEFQNCYFVPFYSNTKLDANFRDGEISSFDLTGIHDDLSQKDNLKDEIYGFSGGIKTDRFSIGTTWYNESFTQIHDEKLSSNFDNNFSIYSNSEIGNFSIFGEIAGNDDDVLKDFIFGFRFNEDKYSQLLLYRNYSDNNKFYHGNPFSATSNPQNEKGIYYGITYTPNSKLKLNCYFDSWIHQEPKYFEKMPTRGNDQLLQLEYKLQQHRIRFLYKRKNKDMYKTFVEESKITNFERDTFRIDWFQSIFDDVWLKNRLEFSFENFDEFDVYNKGILVAQQLLVKKKPLEIVFATAFYKSDILLYLYEYSVDGVMRNSILSGDDIFSYLLLKYQFSKYSEIQFKVSEKWEEKKSGELWLQLVQEF